MSVYIVADLEEEKVLLSTADKFSVQFSEELEEKLKAINGIDDYILD